MAEVEVDQGQVPVVQGPAVPPAQEPVAFSLAPALASHAQVIDFSTSAGAKLFSKQTAALPHEFDLDPKNLKTFLNELRDRSSMCGWSDVLQVPKDVAAPDHDLVSLLTHHGEITLEQVKAHAITYQSFGVRAAQDAFMLYHCLTKSLSPEALNRINLRSDDYFSSDTPSGTCLLKVIIQESYIDSPATIRITREKLSKLDEKMRELDCDILKFNEYVQEQVRVLEARGAESSDLLANLFKGYKSVEDKKFVLYIDRKEEDYDDGTDISPKDLMSAAANKYKIAITTGKWKSPSEEEEKIIALTAQIQSLKKKNAVKPAKPSGGKKGDKEKGRKPREAWMTVPPKPGEPREKTMGDKQYYWCDKAFKNGGHVDSWVRHKPEGCRGSKFRNKKDGKAKKPSDNPQGEQKKALKVSQALASLQEATYEPDDDSSDEE